MQSPTGGNPDAYRFTEHSGLGPGEAIIVNHFNTSAVYDPGVLGPIASVDFSFDLIFLGGSAGSVLMGHFPALEQDGIYFLAGPGSATAQGSGWHSFSFTGITASQILEVNGVVNPDFSASGSPITFGYLNSTTAGAPNTVVRAGIDNWSVTVTPVPEPGTGILAAMGLLLLGGSHRSGPLTSPADRRSR